MGLLKAMTALTAAGAILVVPVAAMAEGTTGAPVSGLSHSSLSSTPVSFSGVRVGAKSRSGSHILGLPVLLVAALGVAATAAVIVVATDNKKSTSP